VSRRADRTTRRGFNAMRHVGNASENIMFNEFRVFFYCSFKNLFND
jgi:hypothetical protein